MSQQHKSKEELVEEMKRLLSRIEELEVVERKYRELTDKIQVLAEQVVGEELIETAASESAEGNLSTLLVVDDNDIFRHFMRELLNKEGYIVYTADGVEDALNILKNVGRKVDLVITDVVMPEGGGNELNKTLKTLYPDIKVLFMSGYTDEILVHTDVQDVIESKAAFIQKPFSKSELLARVKQELNRK